MAFPPPSLRTFFYNALVVAGALTFCVGVSYAATTIGTNISTDGTFAIATSSPGSTFSIGGIANFTSATSTFYSTGGINLTGGGCFAVKGTCVGGGSSGAVTLVSTQTANNSSSLQWTNLSGTMYELNCTHLLPDNNSGIDLYLQFGEGAGPTWKTSGYKDTNAITSAVDLTQSATPGNGSIGNVSPFGINLRAQVNLVASSSAMLLATQYVQTDYSLGAQYGVGGIYNVDSGPFTAIRIVPSSGNWASGSCTLYQLSS